MDRSEPTSAKIAQKSFLGGTVLKTIMANVEVCLEHLEYESQGLRCIESTSGKVRALLHVYNTNKVIPVITSIDVESDWTSATTESPLDL